MPNFNQTHSGTAIKLQTNASNQSTSLNLRGIHGTPIDLVPKDDIVEASRLADANVPDGGYGWVIVTACFIICFWFVGATYSWGILQDRLVAQGLGSASTLAFVGSLAVACNAAFAVINGRLVRLLGARNVAILGISIMSFGQVLSGFCTRSIGGLFVTAGLTMGYGVSCCFMAVSVLPAQYFRRKRGLANGIVFAGGGFGGAAITLALSSVLSRFGIAWTFRGLGLTMFATGIPAACFLKERAPIKHTVIVEWSLFRDFRFLIFFLTGAVATFPLFVPPFFLPLYARSLGLSLQTGAVLLAGFNFASALGRVLCGLMGDKLGPVNSLFISLLLSAVSMLTLWPISTSLGPLIAFSILNGMANGGFFAIMPTVVGNVFGSARVSVAMGMIVTSWTGGYLMGAPIAGYILDAYGGAERGFQAYRPAIFYAGAMSAVAAILVAFVRFRMSKSPLKRL